MASFRFHGSLPQLLSRPWRDQRVISYPLKRRASIKDVLEALGLPHTEPGQLLIGTEEVDFSYLLGEEDRVEVWPLTPPVDVTSPSRLRPDPFPTVRFVADVNVGKLASFLRMLGLDTLYRPDLQDADCARVAATEQRVVLTKDSNLLKRKQVVHGHLVRETTPHRQLLEVVQFYGLRPFLAPFSRCLHCNQLLEPVSKAAVLHRLEPLTKKYYDTFHRCPGCHKIYWAGSHRKKMEALLTALNLNPSHPRSWKL